MPGRASSHPEVPPLPRGNAAAVGAVLGLLQLQLPRQAEPVPAVSLAAPVAFTAALGVAEQSLRAARAAERVGVGLWVGGPYKQPMGLSSLRVGLV